MITPKAFTPAAQGEAFKRMVDQSLKTPFRTIDPDDNEAFRFKVKHVLLPDESLLAFCARTGLGPADAMLKTESEITAFCELAMKRRVDDVVENFATWHQKLEIPKHFTL